MTDKDTVTEGLILRPIQAGDNAAIAKIIKDILKEKGLDIPGTAYFDPQLADLHGFYAAQANAGYWVLAADAVVVGGVGVAPYNQSAEIAELQKLYIHPDHQGLGYATDLFEAALAFAKKQNFKQLYLETSDRLGKATQIYAHYGFKALPAPLSGSVHPAMNRWFIKDIV